MLNNHDKQYLKMALIWASNSHAKRLKVGALIVKERTIISDGYNGTIQGFDNECEVISNGVLVSKKEVLHAEANAITKLAQSNNSGRGATIYVTASPCIECAKLIIQTGIIRVVFYETYSSMEGIHLLKRAGVQVDQLHNLD